MTQEEAIANQQEIVKEGWTLGWWYGTHCTKCHEVYPKFMPSIGTHCWFECEVCGKKGKPGEMAWVAEKNWNDGLFQEAEQFDLFAMM